MSDETEHVLRAWTVAAEYQRVLCKFAAVAHRDVKKVRRVEVEYFEKPCKKCTVEDAELHVKIIYENPAGREESVCFFDQPDVFQLMLQAFTDLSPLVEENGWPKGYGRA